MVKQTFLREPWRVWLEERCGDSLKRLEFAAESIGIEGTGASHLFHGASVDRQCHSSSYCQQHV